MAPIPYFPAQPVPRYIFGSTRPQRADPQSVCKVVCPSIYVLLCQDGWIYVGVSTDVIARIGSHFAGFGASVTKKHPPVCVHQIIYCPERAKAIENEVTEFLCRACGPERVRGGSYCDPGVPPPFRRRVASTHPIMSKLAGDRNSS